MEEDKKVLEEFISRCKECKFATCEQCEINWKQVQAIENLIAGYKELEANLYETNNIISDQIELLKDSISKSKVREKIEEVKNRQAKNFITATEGKLNTIIDLEDLLQEK